MKKIFFIYIIFIKVFCSYASLDLKQARLENERNTIEIYQNAVKSVVNISKIKKVRRRSFLFGDYSSELVEGEGSGFVWSKEGYVVTNFHVVKGGGKFLISFNKNAKKYEAKLLGVEPSKDIAVLKLLELPEKIFPIKKGNSNTLDVGQKALAIGSPFGMDNTITEGIISALGRSIQGVSGVKIFNMIQTDCSINPGNSGGPLFDSRGEVIGMNTVIYSNSGSSAGIGFAVPFSAINRVVPQIIKHGRVKRAGLGIRPLDPYYSKQFGIKKGVAIQYIAPNSPADKAGLQDMREDFKRNIHLGDIIIAIDGKKTNTFDELFNFIFNYNIGDIVEITYLRKGKKNTVKVKLEELQN